MTDNDYNMQIAAILGITMASIAEKKFDVIPKLNKGDIKLEYEKSPNNIKYTVRGLVGDKLDNPYIYLMIVEDMYDINEIQLDDIEEKLYEVYRDLIKANNHLKLGGRTNG